MCYEFVHQCDSALIDYVNKTVSVDKYFLICLDHMNYLYSNDLPAIQIISDIMALKDIRLQSMLDSELIKIINENKAGKFESFHGSVMLYNRFVEENRV